MLRAYLRGTNRRNGRNGSPKFLSFLRFLLFFLRTAPLPLPPRRRWRLRGLSVDGVCFQEAHGFFDRAFELRVVAGDHVLREVLDIDVRRDAFVLDRPLPLAREEAAARRDHRSTIDERRRVGGVNESAPRAFAHERT